jgi:hypothetical protein
MSDLFLRILWVEEKHGVEISIAHVANQRTNQTIPGYQADHSTLVLKSNQLGRILGSSIQP